MIMPNRKNTIESMYQEMDLVYKVVQLNLDRYNGSIDTIVQGLDRLEDDQLNKNMLKERLKYDTFINDIIILGPDNRVIYQLFNNQALVGYVIKSFDNQCMNDISLIRGDHVGHIYMIKCAGDRAYVFDISLENIALTDFSSISNKRHWLMYNDYNEVILSSEDKIVYDLVVAKKEESIDVNGTDLTYEHIEVDKEPYVAVRSIHNIYNAVFYTEVRMTREAFYSQDYSYYILIAVIITLYVLAMLYILIRLRKYILKPIDKLTNRMKVKELDSVGLDAEDMYIYEVGHLNAQYEQMMQTIYHKEQNLKEFVYVASHDLQEPLRVITNYIRILEMETGDTLTGDNKKYFNYVSQGARRMKSLIEELLVYSRTTEKELVKKELDLVEAVNVMKQLLYMQIEEKKGQLSIIGSGKVMADPYGLEMLLQNLMSNSIKFTEEKPDIVITISDEMIQISDKGIGIDEAYFETILKPFSRLHDREVYKGTGIGMAIVQKVVERHGWQLMIESELGIGTTMTVKFKSESI